MAPSASPAWLGAGKPAETRALPCCLLGSSCPSQASCCIGFFGVQGGGGVHIPYVTGAVVMGPSVLRARGCLSLSWGFSRFLWATPTGLGHCHSLMWVSPALAAVHDIFPARSWRFSSVLFCQGHPPSTPTWVAPLGREVFKPLHGWALSWDLYLDLGKLFFLSSLWYHSGRCKLSLHPPNTALPIPKPGMASSLQTFFHILP